MRTPYLAQMRADQTQMVPNAPRLFRHRQLLGARRRRRACAQLRVRSGCPDSACAAPTPAPYPRARLPLPSRHPAPRRRRRQRRPRLPHRR